MKQNKDIRITFRVTPDEYDSIVAKATKVHMTVGAYVRSAALRHRVTVVDGLQEHTRELKGIGRNLNQLTILAHEGNIQVVNLGGTESALEKNYAALCELAEQERR